jgi:bifunctional non-homologous end joining protein LigD
MLARSGRLPSRGAWAYEVKWDGFRTIVSTEGPLRVRSRRGWNMTEHVDFLEQLPLRAVLDGELVAFGPDGKPDFPLVCEAVLHRRTSIPLTFMAFDILSVEGEDVRPLPFVDRRQWQAVCEHELEGVVAKRLHEPYLNGERVWVKIKNRAYWRYELDREGARHQWRRSEEVGRQ